MAENQGNAAWLTATVGFLAGAVFMRLIDLFLPHLHPGLAMSEKEGIGTSRHLVVPAITPHTIAEGVAVSLG